eukprot:TRINITY_DN130681_c0_g1_i1.p1 TRINITY_DN130681_c0_g1~~TRINITY_DN130681_c0_g1_i1.p1  ORF type:complete len:110 (-),score=17.88 TRINITY_DN130681_c0_g1_i1:53-382(-)
MASNDVTLNYVLAGLFLMGGLIGFVSKGSIPSLLGGLLFGVLLGFAASKMSTPRDKIFGYRLASLGSFLAACFMGYRFYLTGSVFPAGVFSVVSALATVWNVLRLNKLE